MVVHAAGRAPALGALDLAAGGVDMQNGRLRLNEYLQSVSNPAVYAAGDAAQTGPAFDAGGGPRRHVTAANLLQGTFGVEVLRLAEGTRRFLVVETVRKH